MKETGKRPPATRLGWMAGTRSCLPATERGTATVSAALRRGSRRLMVLEAVAAAARTGGGASGGFFRGSNLQGQYLTGGLGIFRFFFLLCTVFNTAFQRKKRSNKCSAVQKIAEKRVEIVGCGIKKIGRKTTPRSYRAQH